MESLFLLVNFEGSILLPVQSAICLNTLPELEKNKWCFYNVRLKPELAGLVVCSVSFKLLNEGFNEVSSYRLHVHYGPLKSIIILSRPIWSEE